MLVSNGRAKVVTLVGQERIIIDLPVSLLDSETFLDDLNNHCLALVGYLTKAKNLMTKNNITAEELINNRSKYWESDKESYWIGEHQ